MAVVEKCENAGADFIDINSGPLTREPEEGMRFLIDPIVVPITWDNGAVQAREVLTVIRQLPELLGFPVKTIAGVSNLTAGNASSEKKQALEGAYIAMLAEAGLSMALVNMFNQETIRIARACNVLAQDKIFMWEEL